VPKGLMVLHHCDNPPCVNPQHLYVGTHSDNMRDRKLRQRDARGTNVNTNKLSEDDVQEIRWLCQDGIMKRKIADAYDVTPAQIGQISSNKVWKWLPWEPRQPNPFVIEQLLVRHLLQEKGTSS